MSTIKRMILAALFLALALYLPFLTGQIPQIGSMISPMHFPVLLTGFVSGTGYGLAVGFIAPLLRSFLFGMPPFPLVALPMALELAAYGFLTGLFYKMLPKRPGSIYGALLAAMVGGRIVWGLARYAMLFTGTPFTWEMYISAVIVGSLPGIVLQILLIPLIVMALQRAGLMEDV